MSFVKSIVFSLICRGSFSYRQWEFDVSFFELGIETLSQDVLPCDSKEGVTLISGNGTPFFFFQSFFFLYVCSRVRWNFIWLCWLENAKLYVIIALSNRL